MERKLIICQCRGKILAATMEDQKVVELQYIPDQSNHEIQLGDIYVGRISKILPNIHAAFVDVGDHCSCYLPLDEKSMPIFTRKLGKKAYAEGDELLVQIEKEAVRSKQPVVTTKLSFTGTYSVLTSGNLLKGVSKKITGEQRLALQELLTEYEAFPFGIILRTNASNVSTEILREEINALKDKFMKVLTYSKTRAVHSCVSRSATELEKVLTNLYTEGLTEIIVEAPLAEEVLSFVKENRTELLPYIKEYKDPSYPLCKCYPLEKATDEAMSEKVWMKSGAYLVIQKTEALYMIDVNSGKSDPKKLSFMDINKEAAYESARQIRLRNLSGIILIDFINLDTEEDRAELLRHLRQCMYNDPNPAKVIDMTALQLTELTRRKIRKTLAESLSERA